MKLFNFSLFLSFLSLYAMFVKNIPYIHLEHLLLDAVFTNDVITFSHFTLLYPGALLVGLDITHCVSSIARYYSLRLKHYSLRFSSTAHARLAYGLITMLSLNVFNFEANVIMARSSFLIWRLNLYFHLVTLCIHQTHTFYRKYILFLIWYVHVFERACVCVCVRCTLLSRKYILSVFI